MAEAAWQATGTSLEQPAHAAAQRAKAWILRLAQSGQGKGGIGPVRGRGSVYEVKNQDWHFALWFTTYHTHTHSYTPPQYYTHIHTYTPTILVTHHTHTLYTHTTPHRCHTLHTHIHIPIPYNTTHTSHTLYTHTTSHRYHTLYTHHNTTHASHTHTLHTYMTHYTHTHNTYTTPPPSST